MAKSDLSPQSNSTTNKKKSDDDKSSSSSSVQVAVRIRPLSRMEKRRVDNVPCVHVVERRGDGDTIEIGLPGHHHYDHEHDNNDKHQHNNNNKPSSSSSSRFTFDFALDEETSQSSLYERVVSPLTRACLEGYNATVLAYGQTGSGKTFTVVGPTNSSSGGSTGSSGGQISDPSIHGLSDDSGLIHRAVREVFDTLNQQKEDYKTRFSGGSTDATTKTFDYQVQIQFLEVYGEEIRDLLVPSSSSGGGKGNNPKIRVRYSNIDGEPQATGAQTMKVNTPEESLLFLNRGFLRRVTGATKMNAESSRSHAIMTLLVEQTTNTTTTNTAPTKTHTVTKRSKFHFVDLAGSERQKRTQATGQRFQEAVGINKGLLVLGNVISALGDARKAGKAHVPWRESQLTRLLKGSLGGNHKTLMICCVSPASSNLEESGTALKYANRAKNIRNHAVVNNTEGGDKENSRMVIQLRDNCQMLALEILKMRELYDIKDAEENSAFKSDYLVSLSEGGAEGEGNGNKKKVEHPMSKRIALMKLSPPTLSQPLSSTYTTDTTTSTNITSQTLLPLSSIDDDEDSFISSTNTNNERDEEEIRQSHMRKELELNMLLENGDFLDETLSSSAPPHKQSKSARRAKQEFAHQFLKVWRSLNTFCIGGSRRRRTASSRHYNNSNYDKGFGQLYVV